MAWYLFQLSAYMLPLQWSAQEWRGSFLLPRIFLFSSPCLYFLSGWPTNTSCLANQRFIKIHDWQNTDNSPAPTLLVGVVLKSLLKTEQSKDPKENYIDKFKKNNNNSKKMEGGEGQKRGERKREKKKLQIYNNGCFSVPYSFNVHFVNWCIKCGSSFGVNSAP